MKTAQGKFQQDTENYVNNICQAFIEPSGRWHKIECRHMGTDGIAFVKLKDTTGNCFYFDITAADTETIGILVAAIVSGHIEDIAHLEITQFEQRKELANLFGN